MHVTCAQNEALMTKGKSNSLFCDLHRDIGALSRIIKKTQEHQHQKHPRSSSSTSSGFHRSTKRSRSYRESSIETEDEVDDDEDDDDDVVEDDDNASDGDVLDPTADDDSEDDRRRSKSASSSSATSTPGARGHSKSKRSVDSTERRRRERSSDSEEIDVDDTEAVLGSSTGGGSGSTAQRKKLKSGNIKGPKESAAESQRRRLLMSLDKSKKKQGTSSGSGLNNIANLSAMPIRTLGGLGAPASTVPNAETKQKLPGISRYGYNNSSNTSLLSNDNPSPNPYASGNGLSPSTSSTERFSGNGYNQSSGRGPNEGSGRNLKGLAFDLHPGLDVTTFKGASPLLGSVSASPVVSSFSNSGSPVHARMGDKQQYSPKSGSGLFEDSKDAQNLIRTLQAKLANQESTIQAMTLQTQQLQKQLSNGKTNGNDNHSINGAPTSHTLSSSVSAPSVTHQHHTSGTPGQDLQHRLDRLQHTHAEEKMRNLTLRQNLRDLFGFLQVPVTTSPATGGDSHSTLQLDWNSEKLDDYVQALRDSVVGPEPSRSTLDVKKRDMVVDKVLREIGG
ncbi:hypothetical protein EDD11_008055 [Mortierella claussenii]|nr:hypothetical protein EDD11_008055 [Mortierella claussenii]